MKPSDDSGIEGRVLDEAADWLMRLADTNATEADRAACLRWQAADPEHARAWTRAEALLGKLEAVPSAVALPVLDRPPDPGRRRALGRLAVLLALLPAGWLGLRLAAHGPWAADHRTGVGERLDVTTADGSRITLDTASAITVDFTETERLIRLRAGRILVQTVVDPLAASPARDGRPGRPFRVQTRNGLLEALGTRFTVRDADGHSEVTVLAGRVRATPLSGPARLFEAGQQARFDSMAVAEPTGVDPGAAAWINGMLLADRLPLGELVEELGRYRRGVIRCEPALASLPISGSFPIGDAAATDRTLTMLAATYPIRVRRGAGGLWVRLESRGSTGSSGSGMRD